MEVAIPHALGRDEVRNRLRSRSHMIADGIPGGMAQVETAWASEDRMTLDISAMGQVLTGLLDMEDVLSYVVYLAESLVGGLSPAASAWDLVYAVAGRHIGVLFTFAPLLLLLALGGATRDALPLWGATLLGLVLIALLRPFDLGGSELALGLRTFLPFFAALWMLPARPARPAELLAAAALAGAFIWPLWAAPLEPWGEGGTPRWVPRYLAPWTPVETTQVRLPLGARVPFGGGEALLLPGEALGRGSVARVPTGGWVEVVIGVPDDLVGAWIEAGEQASSELPVRGGELTELMFRPDGGIAFLVRPKRAWIRHGLPGRAGTWSFYRLGVRFPAPEGREFTIRVRPG